MDDDDPSSAADPRDYDVDYYQRVLRTSFASRMERALEPRIYAAVFDDPMQPSLFSETLADARPTLTIIREGT